MTVPLATRVSEAGRAPVQAMTYLDGVIGSGQAALQLLRLACGYGGRLLMHRCSLLS